MIHEVLLALVGHTGGLIYEEPDRFALVKPTDFLSEAERHIVERAVQAGFLFKRLTSFVDLVKRDQVRAAAKSSDGLATGAQRSATSGGAPAPGGDAGLAGAATHGGRLGHYVFGATLRMEAVLSAYRDRVVDLETQLLKDPSLPLLHLIPALEENRRTLLTLHRLATRIATSNVSGGPLLDLLWNTAASHMGTGVLYDHLWSVVEGAGQVLVNQLVAWLIYGRLIDPDHEFFVVEASYEQEPATSLNSALFGGSPFDDFSKELDAVVAQREWQGRFFLKPTAVPHTVISLEVAKTALFVGKAVRVLLRSKRWLQVDAAAGGRGAMQPAELQEEIDVLRRCFSTKSPTYVVQRCIERIRTSAASQLRQLVVVEAELVQHLAALKGFYLLGYGSFYQRFLEASRPLFARPPAAKAQPEAELVHGPWAAAMHELEVVAEAPGPSMGSPKASASSSARQTPLERYLAPRFSICFVPDEAEIQRLSSSDAWLKSLKLHYVVPWPLPLVVTQHSLEQYNQLFTLLLSFRHACLELRRVELPLDYLQAWALRAQLSSFVSQVLLYFQQDVIESAHQHLLSIIESSQDFDEVVSAHEVFLSTATSNCFLRAPELHAALQAALRIASTFCQQHPGEPLADVAAPRQRGGTVRGSAVDLERLHMEFIMTARSILRMMTAMHQQGVHAHLSELLLRLDYNGFFSGEPLD